MARWFSLTGLNMNLAPVVDVNVNPASPAIGALERSYSADPATVAAHAGWFIDEFRSSGVITVLKHFPGHGSATGDSHLGFTDITLTWRENELIPYSTLLSGGTVDGVMVGHLYNATIDSVYPATLSVSTIGGLLRGRLGYDGVVVSDAMGMRALTDRYSFDEAVVRAVVAGVDILLYTKNQDSLGGSLAKRIVDLIEARVGDGTIPPTRIEESYGRIMRLKERILTTVVAERGGRLPERFSVSNYPNPFNPATVIRLEGPAEGSVDLTFFDILGRIVTERQGIPLTGGRAEGRWEAPPGRGSGVYFCRAVFRAGGSGAVSTRTIRMILLR
jgi:beta-glucosidase-like glycosyl hydrolase